MAIIPPLTLDWEPPWLNAETYTAAADFIATLGGRHDRSAGDNGLFFPSASTVTLPLFGLTGPQWFYRNMRQHRLWVVDRGGRKGKWWCKEEDLPLTAIPKKRRRHPCGRIPSEYSWLLDPLHASKEADWNLVDLGPDRAPPVWVCNLCGRTGVWETWPRNMTGLGDGKYISKCPGCGAEANSNVLGMLVDGLAGEGFRPTRRMQDDLWFTL